jgi:hypothetical protein
MHLVEGVVGICIKIPMENIKLVTFKLKQMTNSEKAIAQLFGVLCSVVKSEHTPQATKQATISTFQHLIGEDGSPFLEDELIQLSIAMDNEMQSIVRQLNGDRILNNVLTNNINLN